MVFLSFAFHLDFQPLQRPQVPILKLTDPPFPDGMDGNGIQVMFFVASALQGRDQVRPFQDAEVLAHRLASHFQARAEFAQALAVFRKQPVQKPAPFAMSQRFEDGIGIHAQELYATNWLHVNSPSR
jgi:hypothetical protein